MFCACKYRRSRDVSYFFFNDTATTEIYTLSLHDALPISFDLVKVKGRHYYIYNYTGHLNDMKNVSIILSYPKESFQKEGRSEEHTSELQSRQYLVCRLLLEKKKKQEFKLQ